MKPHDHGNARVNRQWKDEQHLSCWDESNIYSEKGGKAKDVGEWNFSPGIPIPHLKTNSLKRVRENLRAGNRSPGNRGYHEKMVERVKTIQRNAENMKRAAPFRVFWARRRERRPFNNCRSYGGQEVPRDRRGKRNRMDREIGGDGMLRCTLEERRKVNKTVQHHRNSTTT